MNFEELTDKEKAEILRIERLKKFVADHVPPSNSVKSIGYIAHMPGIPDIHGQRMLAAFQHGYEVGKAEKS